MPVDAFAEYREFYNADEAEAWAEMHYPDLCGEQRINNPDYIRLSDYGGTRYKAYNKTLRYDWACNQDTLAEIEQLTDILNRYKTPEAVVAYRYTHKRDIKLLLQGKRLRAGLRFADKAFFSTSLVRKSIESFRKKYDCDCLLKLYLPKGVQGVYLSWRGTGSRLNEQELLLQRDTEFEIIKIHRFCRPMVIECKAIIKSTPEV